MKRRRKTNVVPGLKWCPKCLHRLDRRAFGHDLTRHDGITGWCRACRAGAQKQRRDSGEAFTVPLIGETRDSVDNYVHDVEKVEE